MTPRMCPVWVFVVGIFSRKAKLNTGWVLSTLSCQYLYKWINKWKIIDNLILHTDLDTFFNNNFNICVDWERLPVPVISISSLIFLNENTINKVKYYLLRCHLAKSIINHVKKHKKYVKWITHSYIWIIFNIRN